MEHTRMQIPGYEIIRKIGEGGSRTAYLARKHHCRDASVVKVFKTDRVHERIKDQRKRRLLHKYRFDEEVVTFGKTIVV